MRYLLSTTAVLVALASPAFATDRTPTNSAAAHAGANAAAIGVGVGVGIAGAAARGGNARSRATGGNASAGGGTGGQGGSASVTNNVQAGGGASGGDYGRRVPDAMAPAIWSNNPCVVALSGGVSVAGFGASIGAGIEDRDCTRRAMAQHLTAMGEQGAAREVLCESAEVRAAFRRVGRPCAADTPAPAPMTSVAYREVIGGGAPPPRRALPAYCSVPGIANSECRQ